MKRLKSFMLLFLLISTGAEAQKVGIEYITAIDTLEANHHLSFNKDGTLTLVFSAGRGVNWNIKNPRTFKYKKVNNTIHISLVNQSDLPTLNRIEKRIVNSKFIVESKNQLRDSNSGYLYVSKKCVNKFKYGIIVIENEPYVIKNKRKSRLHRKLKHVDMNNYKTQTLRGKKALDKYGIIGIYGVIEITKINTQ